MKVGLLLICTGELYWPYAKTLIESAHTHFLTNHQVEYLLWTDIPSEDDVQMRVANVYGTSEYISRRLQALKREPTPQEIEGIQKEAWEYGGVANKSVEYVRSLPEIKLFPTDHTAWPYPTLMRYHLFLQQEEALSKYDYLFYCDIDMLMVGPIGDEIFGERLTAAQHPMYALRKEYQAPFEPNPNSAAYVKVPQFYYAGGFQGGKTQHFLEAMKGMKKNIDRDLTNNYIARWNDETHWNKYLFDNQPSIVLSPSYIYPDSLINEYYVKVWGCDYPKRIVTLTKKFSLSKEGSDHIQQFIQTT